jgi:hypothetical protein
MSLRRICRKRIAAFETLVDNGFGEESLAIFEQVLAGLAAFARAADIGFDEAGLRRAYQEAREQTATAGCPPRRLCDAAAAAFEDMAKQCAASQARVSRAATAGKLAVLGLVLLLAVLSWRDFRQASLEKEQAARDEQMRLEALRAHPAITLKQRLDKERSALYEAITQADSLRAQADSAKEKAAAAAASLQNFEASYRTLLTGMRLTDLAKLDQALHCYHAAHGGYPANADFEGRVGGGGKIQETWIPGLTPECLDVLPLDPRLDSDPSHQYLYRSDGRDYKLIAHHPDDGQEVAASHPEMIDPVRGPLAYGYWSPGAKDW